MRKVRTGMAIGLIAQFALLIALAATVSLGPVGWLVGVSCGVITNLALARGLEREGAIGMGPADKVTLARATLVGGVAALVVDSFSGPISVPTLVSLSAVALVLDAVDGWVARRTGTATPLGSRFDMEIDAFLILVLSLYVARLTGDWWVLTIGAARYVFVAVGWLQPWLRGSLPPRYWRKVVAATQGIVLTIVAADVLPPWLTTTALAVSLALLAESFGRDVWWLWRRRTVLDDGGRPGADQHSANQPGADQHSADQPGADQHSANQPGADQHSANQPGADQQGADQHSANQHSANQHSADQHSADQHSAKKRRPARVAAGFITTILACALVWFALVAPNHVSQLTPAAFLRIPLEGILLIALVLVLPARASGILAVAVGGILGVLTLLKIIDMGFFQTLDRPFSPLTDWTYLGSAIGLISDSIGRGGAFVAPAAGVAVLALMPLAVLRLTRLAGRHRSTSIRSVAAIGGVWVLAAVLGVQILHGTPVASTSAADLTYDQVNRIRDGLADQLAFAQALAADQSSGNSSPTPVALAAAQVSGDSSPVPGTATPSTAVAAAPTGASGTAPASLLTALRGKDVIIAFVESYGRVAVQDSSFAPAITATLDAGTSQLQQAGFSSKSGFLTSPTFGGLSWLAHSTFQSGLRIDNQRRYDQLVASDRLTLTGAFKKAGWRTVADVPSNEKEWPEGASFYHYDQIYDGTNVGYQGPKFSYARVTDQYTMSAFQRLELAQPDRGPVMAEIDLVSSHFPWAPLPHMIDWADVGDGSAFNGMPEAGQSPDVMAQDQEQVRAAYGQSIQYSLNTLISFVRTYGDQNLVLIMLGDHEPASSVSGEGTTHDVPISIVAHDPSVLAQISDWGWQDGLRPGPQAPVWPMEDFRDRFLTAYGP